MINRGINKNFPKVHLDKKTKAKAKECLGVERQVIVHTTLHTHTNGAKIRIWPSTYLVPKGSKKKYKLLHFFNIILHPKFIIIPAFSTHTFTLVFPSLPEDCREFDLLEETTETGNFEIYDIPRNKLDVYKVEV